MFYVIVKRGQAALAVSLILASMLACAQTSVAPAGEGTAEHPYQIAELGHLVWMQEHVSESADKRYRLMNDIDAAETAGWNDGEGFAGIGSPITVGLDFRGIFNGAGHVMRGLTIGSFWNGGVGLFATIGTDGVVENLALVGGRVFSENTAGSIAAVNRGVIRNCLVAVSVTGNPSGGIVGLQDDGMIERCVATGSVVSRDSICGSLVGLLLGGSITQCCASADLVGNNKGGLAGVDSSWDLSFHPQWVSGSYWDIERCGTSLSLGGGEARTSAEMKRQATFEGWDFENVWGIAEGESTPYLRMFPPPFTLNVVTQGVGRVEIAPLKATYQPGERVTLTAYSDAPGYVFSHWAGGESNLLTTVTTVAMTGHHTVCAVFEPAADISTVEQLQSISDMEGNYRLAQDIDAWATTNWNGGAGFVPIGHYLNAFTGIFDGNGHVIRGLTMNGSTLGVFSDVCAGAAIRRVGVVGGSMTGVAGGVLVSCMKDSRIEECYSSCDLAAEACAGGLVGDCGGVLVDCHATGMVRSEQGRAGGLVGLNGKNSYAGIVQGVDFRITRCFAAGEVIGGASSENVGGLVGINAGEISACFASGNVSGYNRVGGLVGENQTGVRRCFATGTVKGFYCVGGLFGMADISWPSGETSPIGECFAAGTVIGTDPGGYIGGWSGSYEFPGQPPVFWDLDASWQGRHLTSLPHFGHRSGAQMKQQATYEGWDFDTVWDLGEGVTYPYLSGVGQPFLLNVQTVGSGTVTVSPLKESYEPGERVSVIAKPANGSIVFARWNGAVADVDNPAAVVTMDTHRTLTAYFSGPVTDIETVEELQLIGNDPAYPPSGCYRLACDIGASATTNWNNGQGFLPIALFSGVFDGNGHTLEGLSINRPQEIFVGLFSDVTSEGVVRNLRMTHASVVGGSGVGCVVAENFGRVARCEVSGDVAGSQRVGSVVGFNSLGIVSGCSAAGNVKGQQFVGGIAGIVDLACVDRCYAASALDCADVAGGVSSVGYGYFLGQITRSYWDAEASGCATSAGGEGKSTADMMRQATYAGWDFSTEWGIDEGTGYPFLWQFRVTLPPGVGVADGTNRPAYAAWAASHANAWGTADFSGMPPRDFETAWLLDQRPEAGFAEASGLSVAGFEVGPSEIRVRLALTAAGAAKQGGVNAWLAVQGKAALTDAWTVIAAQQAGDDRLAFADGTATVTFARPAGYAFFCPVLLPSCADAAIPLHQAAQ